MRLPVSLSVHRAASPHCLCWKTDRDDGRDGDGALRTAAQMDSVVVVGEMAGAQRFALILRIRNVDVRQPVWSRLFVCLLAASAKAGLAVQSVLVEEAARSGRLAARQWLQREVDSRSICHALGHSCHQQNARLLARPGAETQGQKGRLGVHGRLQRVAPQLQTLQTHGHTAMHASAIGASGWTMDCDCAKGALCVCGAVAVQCAVECAG